MMIATVVMLRRFLISSLSLAAVAAVAVAQPTTAPTSQPVDGSLAERLEAIDARAAAIEDLTASFIQEKQSPLLRDPLVTPGEVRAVTSATLWTSHGTTPTILSVNTDRLRIYYVDQKVVEEYPVQGNIAAMTASPLPRLEALRESFQIEADDGEGLAASPESVEDVDAVALRLTPITEQLAENIEQVRVLLDAQRGVVLVFEVTDPDGEITTMRFNNIQTNVGLSPDDLRLDLPAGVEVVRPLGDGAEQ